ncbi:hypothetical protein G2W53_018024 [Senna tora]|uniref:Uncharacterized protein n=1 Tax=Senna tora TaxID=362788 RepID=A0A834TR64_9FABA|nr:hypothetical protein G2W53_018024 [Senna tora]
MLFGILAATAMVKASDNRKQGSCVGDLYMGWLEEVLARTARLRRSLPARPSSCSLMVMLMGMLPYLYEPCGLGLAALVVSFQRNVWKWLREQAQPTGASGSSGEAEACGSHKVVVLGFLVCSDKYSETLANVDIKRIVVILDGVRFFHFYKLLWMVLESDVDGIHNSNIAKSILVGLPFLHGVDNLILAITFCVFAIDEDTIGPAERSVTVQQLLESGVGLGVPVTHKNVELYYLEYEKHHAGP